MNTNSNDVERMPFVLRSAILDRSAWCPLDLATDESWLHVLTALEVDEITRFVSSHKDLGIHIDQGVAHAGLPLIGARMQAVRRELITGRGFSVVRGLPVQRWSTQEAALAYWALGAHLGDAVAQSSSGDLGHVHNRGELRRGSQHNRGYLSNAKLGMHCDFADLVGLLCYRKAKIGGDSFLASCTTIHNILAAEHPEYLDVLYKGFYWTRNGEQDATEAPHSGVRIPAFVYEDEQLSARINRGYMERGTRMVDGELTQLQSSALQFIADTAWREDIAFKQTMEPGDAQFVNNYLILHSRNEFEDWPEPDARRLLLRLWLQVPGIRNFGDIEHVMRVVPLVYGNQGRTPKDLDERGINQPLEGGFTS